MNRNNPYQPRLSHSTNITDTIDDIAPAELTNVESVFNVIPRSFYNIRTTSRVCIDCTLNILYCSIERRQICYRLILLAVIIIGIVLIIDSKLHRQCLERFCPNFIIGITLISFSIIYVIDLYLLLRFCRILPLDDYLASLLINIYLFSQVINVLFHRQLRLIVYICTFCLIDSNSLYSTSVGHESSTV